MIRPAPQAMAANAGIAGIVLAGGRGQRLGRGEKGLCRLGGHSLLERALARAAPQTGQPDGRTAAVVASQRDAVTIGRRFSAGAVARHVPFHFYRSRPGGTR